MSIDVSLSSPIRQTAESPSLRSFKRLSCLLILCLLSVSVSSYAQRYVEISADFEMQAGGPNDAVSTNRRSISFECVVGTNEWRIDPHFQPGGGSHWLYDGTNLFDNMVVIQRRKLTKNSTASTAGGAGAQPSEVTNTISGVHIYDSRDGCPLGDWSVNVPWLIFCSGSYLKREGRIIPLFLADLRHAPDGFGYSDKTRVFDDELGLPRSIDLFTSEALFEASVKSDVFLGKHDVELWKKGSMGLKFGSIPDGMLKFHYAVTESTNLLGWNIPTKFEFVQNGLDAKDDWVPVCSGHGRVTSVRPSAKPPGVIVPGMGQQIVDWRFHDAAKSVTAIVYQSTNSSALPTNNPELQKKYRAQLERALAQQSAPNSNGQTGTCTNVSPETNNSSGSPVRVPK